MKILFSLFLFCFIGSSAYAHTFIGNGGEGLRVGDKLFVRDLYEASNHLSPYFGSTIDSKFLNLKENSSLSRIHFSRDLLRKKLTDINLFESFLGYYILQAINQYNWIFTEEKLGLLPDDGPIIAIASDARVQIANRDLGNIRLHRASWDQLSEQGKIALIIHEAVFSLLKPICNSQSSCDIMYQSPRLAREITALFFLPPNKKSFDERLKQSLSLPQEMAYCPHGNVGIQLQDSQSLKKFVQENGEDVASRESFFDSTCAEVAKRKGYKINVKLFREPFTVKTYVYATPYGPQSSIMMKERSWDHSEFIEFNDVEACKERLKFLATNWYEKNLNSANRTSCMTSSDDSEVVQTLIQFNRFSNANESTYYSESEVVALKDFSLKQKNAFALFSKRTSFLIPLYQCSWSNNYFLTTASGCEGKKDESVLIGYLSRTSIEGAQKAFFRCLNTKTNTRFVTTQEESCYVHPIRLEGLLGYVP